MILSGSIRKSKLKKQLFSLIDSLGFKLSYRRYNGLNAFDFANEFH